MSQISAGNNITIDMEPESWRLMVNSEGTPRVLVEVAPGQPLHYTPTFGNSRRLPDDGVLTADAVQQVVIGWSVSDESWHLGLVLESYLATQRGSRWCELAAWPDTDATVFADLAQDAGQNLARIIARPFRVIPPQIAKPAAPPPPPPLPSLPLQFGGWTLDWENGTGSPLHLRRTSNWRFGKVLRILWYTFWLAVYLVLSVATLTSGLALPNAGTMLPNPALLPYLGLGVAVILVGMIVHLVYELLTNPDHVRVDSADHFVSVLHGDSEKWRIAASEAQSLYVTQVVAKKGKQYLIQDGEVNLHLGGGIFRPIFQPQQSDDTARPWKIEPGTETDAVLPLTRETVSSDLQAIGLYIAENLGAIPCWYDRRVK